tara:strand:+ start:67 stop:381 length:315 start_codon:yes stop_codon:yes gene_type:complete
MNYNLNLSEKFLYDFVIKSESIIDELLNKMSKKDYDIIMKQIENIPRDELLISAIDYVKLKFSPIVFKKFSPFSSIDSNLDTFEYYNSQFSSKKDLDELINHKF